MSSNNSLPYNLRSGNIAFADQVMANFYALNGQISHISLGDNTGNVQQIIDLLAQTMVQAGETGNASNIIFDDGESVAEKFDNDKLIAMVHTGAGLFYFSLGADGHLYLTASENVKEGDFQIDENGHLLYSLPDPTAPANVRTYDLGMVRGEKGDAATGMDPLIYDPDSKKQNFAHYTARFLCNPGDWDANKELLLDSSKQTSGDSLTGIISPTKGVIFYGFDEEAATAEQAKAWREAEVREVAKLDGAIRLRAEGTVPAVSIPVTAIFMV